MADPSIKPMYKASRTQRKISPNGTILEEQIVSVETTTSEGAIRMLNKLWLK